MKYNRKICNLRLLRLEDLKDISSSNSHKDHELREKRSQQTPDRNNSHHVNMDVEYERDGFLRQFLIEAAVN